MRIRWQLLQEWRRVCGVHLGGVRKSQREVLALFVVGMVLAGNVRLQQVAQAVPHQVLSASVERRLRRWLANSAVSVEALWAPFAQLLLQSRQRQDVLLTLDPTPRRSPGPIYVLGLVTHKRIVPLAWHVVADRRAENEPERVFVGRMCRRVARWLTNCQVTLVADQGLTGPDLINLCADLGWHWVLRVSADAKQGPKLPDGRSVWELVRGPGQKTYLATKLFKRVGWIAVGLTISWTPGFDRPWILVSDLPAGHARVCTYRRRWQAEATYQDCKTRGWRLDTSRVTHPRRVERLLLVLALALWWTHDLGLTVIKRGMRRQFDRADRREFSVMRLGRMFLDDQLLHDRLPPFPFARPPGEAAT